MLFFLYYMVIFTFISNPGFVSVHILCLLPKAGKQLNTI